MFTNKLINAVLLLFCFSIIPIAKAQLAAGDIAIVAFDADSQDGFSFVVLNPDGIAAGQTIFFSDDGYTAASGLDMTEGRITWTATASIPAGTIVDIMCARNTNSCPIFTSHGTVDETDNGFNLAGGGDIVLAFVGTDQNTPTTFLTLFSTEAYATEPTEVPPGLVDGETAIQFAVNDNQDVILHTTIQSLDCSAVTPVVCSAMIYSDETNFATQNGGGDQSIDGLFPDFPADVPATMAGAPTPVTLSSFSSTRVGNKLDINWGTSSELFNVGFQLWGLDGTDGQWEKLHNWLVRSGSGNAVEPQSYSKRVKVPSSIDQLVSLGISSVDSDGSEHYYGPFEVGTVHGELAELEPIAWDLIRAELDAEMVENGYVRNGVNGYRKALVEPSDAVTSPYVLSSELLSVVEFSVSKSGVYRITSSELLAAGIDWSGVSRGDVALLDNNDEAVVRHVLAKGEGNGQSKTLGVNGEIYFYGLTPDADSGLYTNSNVYRLILDPDRALQAQTQGKTGVNSGFSESYKAYSEVELDKTYMLSSVLDDPWVDAVVVGYPDKPGLYGVQVPVQDDALWSEGSSLKLDLGRSSSLNAIDADGDGNQDSEHMVEGLVLSGGNLEGVGVETANSSGKWDVEFAIPVDMVLDNTNGNVLVGGAFSVGNGYELSEVHVDSVGVEYYRPYVAKQGNDYLSFAGPNEGELGYQVLVPKRGNVKIFATDGSNLVRLKAETKITTTDDSGKVFTKVTFAALQGVELAAEASPIQYWVGNNEGYMSVAELNSKPVASAEALLAQASGSNYLLIAHPMFMDDGEGVLSEFQAFKQDQGYSVSVINYLDVVDGYGGGQAGPDGLTEYLAAVEAQGSGVDYVLLVGGSVYDHTDNQQTGALTFIPSHYGESSYSKYTASDVPYITDSEGELFASIGRWPVRSMADFEIIVAKSIQWSSTDHSSGVALLIAEHTLVGENIDFGAALDGVVNDLPESYEQMRVYVDQILEANPDYSEAQAINEGRSQIIQELSTHPDLVMYNGHASTRQLSSKSLYKWSNVGESTPGGAEMWLPLSCYVTYYESTHVNTLAHQLMFSGNAVNITGAMLLSNQNENLQMGSSILDATLIQGQSIGEAVNQAKATYNNAQLNINWSTLGDPTLSF